MAAAASRLRAARRLAHTLRSVPRTPTPAPPAASAIAAAAAAPVRRPADAHSALAAASVLRRHLTSAAVPLAPDSLTLNPDKPSAPQPPLLTSLPPDDFDDT
ncbi:hypothetical protein BWQ96_02843 [Gracilariopsis chorda]|uniref:Uncharacterized protein n=1 Tax=Gracilariopsis chorda TaxID=448386 RepID=A0A2V3IZ82_9FLOR|nr:hypothetical protein BWQ96_02843 [Gracilariopsis chorda]|eukprot:PXF47363.1 hypothetical protein BWQ96_02843 [Gracilariopsis chorda]